WLGLMGQWAFSIELPWLPTTGREMSRDPVTPITHLYLIDTLIAGRFDQFVQVLRHLILPVFALATIPMAIIARITRYVRLEVMRSDFILTARAKGQQMFFYVSHQQIQHRILQVLATI